MSRFKIGIAALGATIGILTATSVGAWERGPVDVLAVLPDVTQNVQSSAEGLTVGPDGNIYVRRSASTPMALSPATRC